MKILLLALSILMTLVAFGRALQTRHKFEMLTSYIFSAVYLLISIYIGGFLI